MYHVSAATNRESIREHGLVAGRPPVPGQRSLTMSIWAISGQEYANYLAPDLETARHYIEHLHQRFAPMWPSARTHRDQQDIWRVDVSGLDLEPDRDYPRACFWTAADIDPKRLRLAKKATLD